SGRNVLPLGELLRRRTAGRPGDGSSLPQRTLGRLLLERRSSSFYAWRAFAWVCGLGIVLYVVWLGSLIIRAEGTGLREMLSVVGMAGGTALGLGVLAWRERRDRLRFHVRGVCHSRRGRELVLFHDKLGVVVWGRWLILEPMPGLGR